MERSLDMGTNEFTRREEYKPLLLTITVDEDTLKHVLNAAWDGVNNKLECGTHDLTIEIGRTEKKALRVFEQEVKSAKES